MDDCLSLLNQRINDMRLISIVGVESTGKTTLATQLATELQGVWLPEYAREYLEKPDYTEEDLLVITGEQLAREVHFVESEPKVGILDTDGIVLLVWWRERFGHAPDFLVEHIRNQTPRQYLLTAVDLAWQPDELRESRHEREYLSHVYDQALREFNLSYDLIEGKGRSRLECALNCLR